MMGNLAAAWGIGGVTLLLAGAMARLAPIATRGLAGPVEPGQWIVLLAWVAFMAYVEGYRGFHLAFAPRVAARARHLADHPTPVRALLAPAFCMAYFAAPPRRRATSWAITAGVVVLVLAVHRIPQPWRGIIDAGVVVGLGMGLLSLLARTVQAFGPRGLDHPAEIVP